MSGARFAVLTRRGRAAVARAHRLHARPAHARARLHRGRRRRSWCRARRCPAPATCRSSRRICSRSPATGICISIPTAEVPLTNLHREEIARRGAAAAEVHGLHAVLPQRGRLLRRRRARPDPAAPVRQGRAREDHARPSSRYDELESLTADAERVLADARACRIGPCCCAPATWGLRRRRPTTSRSGCRASRRIARSRRAATARPSRRGAPRFASVATGRRSRLVAHAERLRPGGRPHADRDPRELPAGRRHRRRARGAAAVHGRPRGYREKRIERLERLERLEHSFAFGVVVSGPWADSWVRLTPDTPSTQLNARLGAGPPPPTRPLASRESRFHSRLQPPNRPPVAPAAPAEWHTLRVCSADA